MAKNNNLTDFLTNTADAIRYAKTNSSTGDAINPQDFETQIKSLNTFDADATAGQILSGKTAYVDGVKVTGTIPTKTSSNLTTSGATVTVPAGYYASNASKSVTTATRANTSISVTADDTNDKLTITGTNTQAAGYVSDTAAKTASTVVTLTASGKTVTATATDGTKVSKDVSTVSRADTTLTVTADDTADTLNIDAANNQGTGYVTGANKTATTTVTLTASGATVTATETGGKKVSKSVASGSISASGTASATTTVAPGTVTIANKTASVSGKTQITAAPTTATSGISTYYMAVDATAAANSTGTTSSISGTATAKVDTAGYVSSDATGSVTGTATAKTSAKSSSTYYIPLASGGCTVAGGGLTVDSNYSGTPTVDITLDGQTTSGAAITDTQPTSGYYLTVGANSSALSGSTKVTRAAVTDTHTAGYIPAKSATTTIASASATPSVTVNKGTKTEYITIPSGNCTVSGGGLSVTNNYSGTPTVDITLDGQTTSGAAITDTKPTSGYYLTVGATSSKLTGSTKVTRAAVTDTHTAGYIPAKSATTVISSTTSSPSVTVNAGSKTEYITLPTGGCTVSGGGLSAGSGSVSASGTNITLTEVSSKPSSGYYVTATGSGSVSRAAITDTHTAGYIPAKSATTVSSATSASSNTATKYYTLPSGSYDASGGGLSAGSGSVSASSSNMTLTESSSAPSSGYYFTATGSGSVNRAAITKSATSGVVSTGSSTVSNATSASSNTATKYYSVPTGSCTVSGGGLSGGSAVTPTVSLSNGSDTNMSNITIGSKNTSTYPYYFKVSGSSSSGSSTVSRAAVKDTHTAGYIPDKSSTTVISSDSKTVTVNAGSGSSYIGLKGASLSASGSATASATVEPGALSIVTQVIPVSGKTQVGVTVSESTTGIKSPFYAAIRPEVTAGSAAISGSGTASASVSSAGYAPTSLTGSGTVSVSGTATSSAKYGNTHYASIPAGAVTVSNTPVTVSPILTCTNGTITAQNSGNISVTPTVTTSGYVTSSQMTAGSISVYGSNTITDDNLVADNIKSGVSIFGVTGTLEGKSNFIPYSPKLTRESSDYVGGTVTYRFQETDDGWWESSNQKVKSSYSLGRFSFDVYETCDVTFEVINYAESNYDYALFSNLGLNGAAYLNASTTADTSNVYKNYKGLSNASIQELTYYNVTPGRYTVAVKFIKDSSGDNYNDSVKFRLKRPTPNSELLPQVEALEPTYQGRGADEPASKYVVNYSGGNYAHIYRNVEEGGWVPDNTNFFGDDYIYFDKINTDYSGLKPENIVAGKTVFGVTGTGPAITNISLRKSATTTVSVGTGMVWSFMTENDNITCNYNNTGVDGTFTITGNTVGTSRLVVKHYTDYTSSSTTLSFYNVTVTS